MTDHENDQAEAREARWRSTSPAPGSILVGVDGSPEADEAIDWAADQAAIEHRPLALVHGRDTIALAGARVYPGSRGAVQDVVDELHTLDEVTLAVARARARARHATVDVTTTSSRRDARSTLIACSRDATMLVVKTRARGPVDP